MEQSPQNYVTANPRRLPICEWCDHFKRNDYAPKNSRFGVCHRLGSTRYLRLIPVALPGCMYFSHPYIKFDPKKKNKKNEDNDTNN